MEPALGELVGRRLSAVERVPGVGDERELLRRLLVHPVLDPQHGLALEREQEQRVALDRPEVREIAEVAAAEAVLAGDEQRLPAALVHQAAGALPPAVALLPREPHRGAIIIATMETAVTDYLDRARRRHVDELSELLRIPSVSTASEHAADMQAAARWLLGHLERIGLEDVRLLETGGNPIVYGEWLHAEGAPTVLVYGHYDVQPSAPDELWASPPFEPEVRDGRLYARGVTDNKGQIFAALAAIEALLAVDGSLPCNVRVLIEGEEELSAENLTAFLTANTGSELLRADLALITDCGMYDEQTPGVTTALRGMAAIAFTLRTAASDVHSGVYGGVRPERGPRAGTAAGDPSRPGERARSWSRASTTTCSRSRRRSGRPGRTCPTTTRSSRPSSAFRA